MRIIKVLIALLGIAASSGGFSLSANKVWMEFRPNGRYRVYVGYTIPELKEYREVTVEFSKKSEAEKYYFDLVRGADFYFPDSKSRGFSQPPTQPEPW